MKKPHEVFAEEDRVDLEHLVVVGWVVGNGSVFEFAQIEATPVNADTCAGCSRPPQNIFYPRAATF